MPTCFIGPPGVGKTALVEDVCGDLNAHLCVISLSCYDASELKGIPRVLPLEELCKLYPEHVKENNSRFVTYYAHNCEFPATNDPDLWVFFRDGRLSRAARASDGHVVRIDRHPHGEQVASKTSTQPQYQQIKLAMDAHAASIVVVRMMDGAKRQLSRLTPQKPVTTS